MPGAPGLGAFGKLMRNFQVRPFHFFESGPQDIIFIDITYDAMGRVHTVSKNKNFGSDLSILHSQMEIEKSDIHLKVVE